MNKEERNMVYIKFYADTFYCGTSAVEYRKFEKMDEDLFETMAQEFGNANAESYEYLAENDVNPDDYDTEDDYDVACAEARDAFWEECSYGWEEVTREEYEEYEG
jgi:hypothetical protein